MLIQFGGAVLIAWFLLFLFKIVDMETLIINIEKSNVKLILELVQKLGGSGKILKKENQDEFSMEEWLGKKDLTQKEITFYKKFRKAVEETKAMEAGEIKSIPLKEVLDEM